MEKEITNLLDEIAADFDGEKSQCQWTKGMWTKEIKRRLVALGEEYSCEVAPLDQGEPFRRAWLYDLIWWRHEKGCLNKMTSVELAMESEWSGKIEELEKDFLKLVYAKARLKLFIFGVITREEYERKLAHLKELANMCEDKNHDKYLFSCTVGEMGEKFIHETFTT